MTTRVKICGITRVDDALAAVRAGAHAVGLVFWPGTPRRVDVATARAIVAALPPMVGVVGLFVDPTADDVRAALDAVPLDLLQFHGSEEPGFCGAFGRRYLKAIAAREGVDLLRCAARYADAAAWIFDAHVPGDLPGGTGRTFDWSRLPRACARPVVLSGGLHADNVGTAIRAVRPFAVDVSSGVEALDAAGKPRRGIKDAARIDAFIEAVRHADDRIEG
jgi:phosphoribosylanthranilate isomerase